MRRSTRRLNQNKPSWIGAYKKCTKLNPFTEVYKTYEGFEFKGVTAYVGDFVLVSNADADEPDPLEGCDVARIDHLFESPYAKTDRYRANVQWYSKPKQIPASLDNDLMDEAYEVFEDCRNYDSNVNVETILKKCLVIDAYEDEIPEQVHIQNRGKCREIFVCRYRVYQKSSKFYIEPIKRLDEMMADYEGADFHSENVQTEKRLAKYVPNTIMTQDQEDPIIKSTDESHGTKSRGRRINPATPKSRTQSSENDPQKKIDSGLRSAFMKCIIDSDSESWKAASSTRNRVTGIQDSDYENSPRSTPRKNPPRSSRKNETPLKSNRINTLGLESNHSNVEKAQRANISTNGKSVLVDHTNQATNNTPTKSSIRKRKASRSSSEESFEPRSPSLSPKINCTGPPAVYKLYEKNGQTFIIKKPFDIEKKVSSKKLDDSTISNLLSSDESDDDLIFESLKKSGTKIVAKSRPNDKGFELLNTPKKTVRLLEDNNESDEVKTPTSARRNLSQSLDIEDDSLDTNESLLLKKIAAKREDASLRIKLRRSSEQSTYKIDSDSDGNANSRSRRRTLLGTPKSILKTNSKGPGTPNVKFNDRNEINEISPTTELSSALMKVEIKLKRIDDEGMRKSPRTRKANSKYADYYVVVQPPVTHNETPSKRVRKTINDNEVDESQRTPRRTRRSVINGLTESVKTLSEQQKTSNPVSQRSRKDSIRVSTTGSEDIEEIRTPRRTRKTANTNDASTPSRRSSKMDCDDIEPATPRRNANTPKLQTPSRSVKSGILTPSMKQRSIKAVAPSTPFQKARARLHVSAVPKSLPCREAEFNNIYSFLEGKLVDNSGGCLYISGVPGTGKTATVNEVIRCLKKSVSKKRIDNFDFIEINAMKLTEPRQAYVEILKQLTGKKTIWEHAHQILDKRFTTASPSRLMTLLLVDELDILCNKRQDVVYNLLDWPAKSSAKLVVITIANTMDLPERVLMGRVTSRLGLTRLTFQPYTHKQLQEIVTTRLNESDAFKSEAIQLVARKVAAVSGDARRALDICRRATEVAELNNSEIVSMQDVNEALTEMIASVKVQAMRHCSEMEQTFLQAVCAEVARTGVEEVVFKNIYIQLQSLCSLEGLEEPSVTEALTICAKLGAFRLLICEHSRADIHQRVLLNVSSDDVHFALQNIVV